MCVVLGKDDDTLLFGKIKLILVSDASVYFVTEKCLSDFLFDMRIYSLNVDGQHTFLNYVCVKWSDLPDYYPLPVYSVFGLSIIAIHHSFPSLE